jgi:hypothetical protein
MCTSEWGNDTEVASLQEKPVHPPVKMMLKKDISCRGSEQILWFVLICIIFLTCFLTIARTWRISSSTIALCKAVDERNGVPVSERMPIFLDYQDIDGYVWNRHAEFAGSDGRLRIRQTDLDNFPYGREVHWNSLYSWYLRFLGECYSKASGESLKNSIYITSIWANPILFILVLILFSIICSQKLGPLCGIGLCLAMFGSPSLENMFAPASPGHYGLISASLIGCLLFMSISNMGWSKFKSDSDKGFLECFKHPEIWIIVSAFCGAAGLWFSAVSTAMTLTGMGLALIVANKVWGSRMITSGLFHLNINELRVWCVLGGAFSLVFYLIEYFPNHLGMRLEVNHPLYSLSWVCGGMILTSLIALLHSDYFKKSFFSWKLFLCIAGFIILPFLILLKTDTYYLPLDPFLQRLWWKVAEFLPFSKRIELGQTNLLEALWPLPIVLPVAIALQFEKSVSLQLRMKILFLSGVSIFLTLLRLYQDRWGNLAMPPLVVLSAIIISTLYNTSFFNRITNKYKKLFLLISFGVLLGGSFCFKSINEIRGASLDTTASLYTRTIVLIHREIASAIRSSLPGKTPIILASPNSSAILACMGGFKTIGTLYWENIEGLKANSEIICAQNEEKARELILKRGITHIVIMDWENFEEGYFQIRNPFPNSTEAWNGCFGKKLLENKIPIWTRPLLLPKSDFSDLIKIDPLILEVVPDQSPKDAKIHLAKYVRISRGDSINAEHIIQSVLKTDPSYLPARTEYYNLLMETGRTNEATAFIKK